MALTAQQQSSRLFKKLMGVSETSVTREFFQEPRSGRSMVLPDQVWNEAERIPLSAPALQHEEVDESGVIQRFINTSLIAVPGTNNSFYSDQLVDAIPFNFGDGTYNYEIKSNTSASIAFGQGDWVVDPDAGVLTFYGSVPANMPPTISFYKYIGRKGIRDSRMVVSSTAPDDPQVGTIWFQLEE